ncbi:AAA family ATPase [Actinomadura sp. 9N215]|uniref:AAA family ATPase n=1 Tax=Actinomadura sp. 9N215 TaxID=3375150 RepID=UPI003795E76F
MSSIAEQGTLRHPRSTGHHALSTEARGWRGVILLERQKELNTLQELFTESLQSISRIAIISGGVATGKTTLLRSVQEKANESGVLFLGAVASPTERKHSLGVLEQLFYGPDLPTALREQAAQWVRSISAIGSAYGPATGFEAAQAPTSAYRRLWEILRNLVGLRPVVIGIDDTHHADESSLQFLLYILRRLRSARLLTVLTECPPYRGTRTPSQGDLLRDPHSYQIRLEPLTDTGVAAMLSSELGEETARRLATDVRRASAGRPPLVRALIEDQLTAPGDRHGEFVAGEAFSQAVLGFLQRHDYPVPDVARGIAILRRPRTPAFLGRLVDIDTMSAAQAVDTLTSAGILTEARFRHRAVQSAVVSGIAPKERRALHDRAAFLLHSEGADATEVAAHVFASNSGDAPWAISILRDAAELALATDDMGKGIRYLRAAYQMSGDRRQRSVIAATLAEAEWRVDPAAVLRHVPDFHTAVRDDLLDAHDALTPISSLLWHGRVPEAVDMLGLLNRRRDDRPETADDPAEAPHSRQLWLAHLYPELFREGPLAEAVSGEPRPRQTADIADHDAISAMASELLRGEAGDLVAIAETLLERARLSPATFAPLAIALATLLYNDRLDSAMTWSETLLDEAAARRSPTWRAFFTALRAMVSLRLGDLVAAERQAETALDLISTKGWGVAVGLPISCLVLARTAMGRLTHAAELLSVPVPEAMFRTPIGLHYIYARGRHHLASGHHQAALYDFRSCGTLMRDWGIDLPAIEPWRLGAAEALVALGDPRGARRLVDEQLAMVDPKLLRTRGISLRAQALTHAPQDRPALLTEATTLLQNCGDLLELSYALSDLGNAHRELGDHERGRELAHKASMLARKCTTGALDPTPAKGTGDIGRHARQINDLTRTHLLIELSEAERRVAELAANGYTNRQISAELSITISTVEQHLTRVYRKLNITRPGLRSVYSSESGDLDRAAPVRPMAQHRVNHLGPEQPRAEVRT